MSGLSPVGFDPRLAGVLSPRGVSTAEGLPQRTGKAEDTDSLLNEFQNVLWVEMMKAMRSAVPKSELFGDSSGQEIFESFLDGEYARAAGRGSGALGLTEVLKAQLNL